MLAGILGRGVNGDASLYCFPMTLGYFLLRKACLHSCWHPSRLYSLWPKRLHPAFCVLCALLYRRGRSSCLRLQRNAATDNYRTRQPGGVWRQASTFQTVSWGSERTSAGVQKTQAQHLTTCSCWLTHCRQDCIAS